VLADVGAPRDEIDADAEVIADPECVPPAASTSILAETEYGFRDAQGACGWSYRYTDANAPDQSVPFTSFDGDRWFILPALAASVTRGGSHPSASYSVIRRWQSPYTGNVVIRGSVRAPETIPTSAGDRNGVVVILLLNGVELIRFDLVANANERDINRGIRIAEGDTLDFFVDSKNQTTFDATNYKIEIAKEK
jgi:hypothetical protein